MVDRHAAIREGGGVRSGPPIWLALLLLLAALWLGVRIVHNVTDALVMAFHGAPAGTPAEWPGRTPP